MIRLVALVGALVVVSATLTTASEAVAASSTALSSTQQPVVTPTPTPTDPPSPEPSPTPTTPSVEPTPDDSVTPPPPSSTPSDTPSTPTPTPTEEPSVTTTPTDPVPSDEPQPSIQRPATPPAARSSGIPIASVLAALAVLAVAALAVHRISRREPGDEAPAEDLPEPDAEPAGDVDTSALWSTDETDSPARGAVAFLVSLGKAMIDSGAAVTQVSASLGRVAAVNGVEAAQVAVFPTALFVSVPGTEDVQTSIASAGRGLRLDQIDAVFKVVDAAEHGEIAPGAGIDQLEAARTMPPPFGVWLRLAGYPLSAIGLVMILRGTWLELLVAAVLASGVGALQLHRSRVPSAYQVFMPVVASFGVSMAVFLLVRADVEFDVFTPLVAPLITFLPGALLTTGVIELATGHMMSGAGRLAQGAMQLVLLAIGIVAAAQLVGVPAISITATSPSTVSSLVAWLGVGVFGVGVVLANSARPSSLGWIVLILYVAYAGQLLGGFLLGSQLSAFAGALLMTPVAMFAADQRSGPPTLVTFMPAFWMLVPGAIGLAGVTKYLGDERLDGATSLISAGSTMIGIAFGVLLGLAAGSVIGLGSGVSLQTTTLDE